MLNIPKFKITNEEEALAAIKQDIYAFLSVPKKLKKARVCLEAVKKSSLALSYTPKKLKTAELCLEAVKYSGFMLSRVPKKVLTAEICFEAMKHDIYAYREGRLEKVDRVEEEAPEELRDEVRRMLKSGE